MSGAVKDPLRALQGARSRAQGGQLEERIEASCTRLAEVTNNANDAEPVWQDATTEVQKGTNIVFSNKTASNGAAFNFRISVSRGASGESGYIEAVTGAFQ